MSKVKVPQIKPKKGFPLKLDIGCGERNNTDGRQGFVGIDIAKCPTVDVVMDVRNTPWPIKDETVEEIYTSHFFEHLAGPERHPFMDECWRVLKPAAKLVIICPHWSSMRSVQDAFHAWPPVCEHSFLYYNKEWREINKLTHYPISCDFDFGYGFAPDPEVGARADDYRMFAFKHYINAINDIHVTLTKRG